MASLDFHLFMRRHIFAKCRSWSGTLSRSTSAGSLLLLVFGMSWNLSRMQPSVTWLHSWVPWVSTRKTSSANFIEIQAASSIAAVNWTNASIDWNRRFNSLIQSRRRVRHSNFFFGLRADIQWTCVLPVPTPALFFADFSSWQKAKSCKDTNIYKECHFFPFNYFSRMFQSIWKSYWEMDIQSAPSWIPAPSSVWSHIFCWVIKKINFNWN